MQKIDGHLHLVRAMAGSKGQGRLNPLGNGYAIWDNGEIIHLIPESWGGDDFRVEKYLPVMKQENIAKAVLLQGTLNGYQNYYTYQVVKRYPQKFIGAFAVDPYDEFALDIVHRHVEDLGFRAIKFEISQGGGLHGFHRPFRLDLDNRCCQIFHYLADYPGFVVTIDYGAYDQATSRKRSSIWPGIIRKWTLLSVTCPFQMPTIQPVCRTSWTNLRPSTTFTSIFRPSKILMVSAATIIRIRVVKSRSAWLSKRWAASGLSGGPTRPGRPPLTVTTSWLIGWPIRISSMLMN